MASELIYLSMQRKLLERVTGIEPVYPAWKAGALADVLHPHMVAQGSGAMHNPQ